MLKPVARMDMIISIAYIVQIESAALYIKRRYRLRVNS